MKSKDLNGRYWFNGEIKPTTCGVCGKVFTLAEGTRYPSMKRKLCSAECVRVYRQTLCTKRFNKKKGFTWRPLIAKGCKVCNREFTSRGGTRVTCSPECYSKCRQGKLNPGWTGGWTHHVYGLDIDTYDRMLREQNGLCAVCGCLPKKRLSVDHDHKTGKVRGLLCTRCNSHLGVVENRELLGQMVIYLERDNDGPEYRKVLVRTYWKEHAGRGSQ